MKKRLLLSILVSVVFVGNAFADGSTANADSLALSSADARALGIGTGGTAVGIGGTGGSADAVALTGSSDASVALDFKPTINTGFTFEASKIPVQAAGFPNAVPATAQLFISNSATNPPQITGVVFSRWVQKTCKQSYTVTSRGSTEKAKGSSGDTLIRATFSPDLNNKRFADDATPPEVSFGLPGLKTKVVCLGTLTVQAKKGGDDVDINVLDLDAAQFALQLKGYKKIWLISPETAIGGALGVETDGKGFGIGGSGAGIAGVVTAALGLSGSVNDGSVNPVTRLGTTHAVFAEPNTEQGSTTIVSVGVNDFDTYYELLRTAAASQPSVSNNGVKDAATKK